VSDDHYHRRKSGQAMPSPIIRRIEQRLVHGDPGQALLDTAGNSPASLSMVGNCGLGVAAGEVLGLGVAAGEVLGPIPAAVVKDA
jgi:maltose/moltooligosaccharide transporter